MPKTYTRLELRLDPGLAQRLQDYAWQIRGSVNIVAGLILDAGLTKIEKKRAKNEKKGDAR